MELVQEHRAPEPLEIVVRVVEQPEDGGVGRPELGLTEQVLAAAVARLRPCLAGVRAAMELQVQLARPDGTVGVLGLCSGEEVAGGLDGHAGRAGEVLRADRPREHLARRAAASVAPPERHQGSRRPPLLREVRHRVGELRAGQLAVVGIHRREVREDPGAVDPLPVEGVVGKPVGGAPRELLSEEPPRAGEAHELRESRGVPERVGQPHLLGLQAELLEEEPLAMHELPGEGLTSRHVGVALDPHAADGQELTFAHPLPHPLEQHRVLLTEPRELLRR